MIRCFLHYPRPVFESSLSDRRPLRRCKTGLSLVSAGNSHRRCYIPKCIASSILDEKEFTARLAGSEYIVLDDVVHVDPTGKIKNWQELDTKAFSRVYENPTYVVLVNPMKG